MENMALACDLEEESEVSSRVEGTGAESRGATFRALSGPVIVSSLSLT